LRCKVIQYSQQMRYPFRLQSL